MGRLIKGPWELKNAEDQDLVVPSDDLEYVAFDVETTGFNKSDRVVEIGLVAFKNGQLLEEWSTLLNPQRDVGKSNIHGITASMVSTAPLFQEIVNDIFRIINGRVLVAHQFSFDARMLAQELNRLDVDGDLGKGFCTLIASRNLLPGTADSLAATCEALGIEKVDAHSALGDARMTMQIFQKLFEDGQEVTHAKVIYDNTLNPSRVLQREAFKKSPDDAIERIKAFTKKVPFPTSDEKFVAYLLLLNMAMQDLVISKAEEAELNLWAEDLDISPTQVQTLHQGYLDSFIQAALRDGVITLQEREMIELVAKALHLPVEIPDSPQLIQANEEGLSL